MDTEQIRFLQNTLAAVEKRLSELKKLVQSVYEDKVRGAIPKAFCTQLMHKRKEKLEQKADFTAKIEAMQKVECGANEWIDMIQNYAKLETLDRPTLLKLI